MARAEPTLASLAAELQALRTRVEALESHAGATVAPGAITAPAPVAADPAPELAVAVADPVVFAAPARQADAQAEIRAVLRSMFAVALQTQPDDTVAFEAGFEHFKELVHHDRRNSPLLVSELMNYKFRPLLQRAHIYLQKPDDPGSFQIDKVTPDRVDGRTESVRVYVKADRRMPPPIALRRDVQAGGAFRIENSSL
jgi:hypothetical protein